MWVLLTLALTALSFYGLYRAIIRADEHDARVAEARLLELRRDLAVSGSARSPVGTERTTVAC